MRLIRNTISVLYSTKVADGHEPPYGSIAIFCSFTMSLELNFLKLSRTDIMN